MAKTTTRTETPADAVDAAIGTAGFERRGRGVSVKSNDEREIHADLTSIAMNALREALDDAAGYAGSAWRGSERRTA